MPEVLVHGLAVAGIAVVEALQRRGWSVTVTDDRGEDVAGRARDLRVELIDVDTALATLDRFDIYSPSPGVPETHRLFMAAPSVTEVCGELELAYRWEQERPGGARPMLAITGTDGKTTTTLLATEILRAAGLRAIAAGNTETPLVTAIDEEVDCFVVESTSFRLAATSRFRGDGAAWLNLAPDHLDWHRDLESYIAAKDQIFSQQSGDDVAVGSLDDPVVASHLARAPARRIGVGTERGDYRIDNERLVGPGGSIMAVAEMKRALPHDRTNALFAAALTLETGLVALDQVAAAVARFTPPAHRIEFLAEDRGIAFYDDSKATTPHAAITAIGAFDSVVLIAGGRNKGLDLTQLRTITERLRAVVAIGEAADEIASIFQPVRPVVVADTMDAAVAQAAAFARPGDVVLLSPACASFDWYPTGGYAERGAHFRSIVESLVKGGNR